LSSGSIFIAGATPDFRSPNDQKILSPSIGYWLARVKQEGKTKKIHNHRSHSAVLGRNQNSLLQRFYNLETFPTAKTP
jgi:hypothetical protein